MNRWVLLYSGLFLTWIFGQNLGMIPLSIGLVSLGLATYSWKDNE